jgi:hypothetical protein
MSSASIPSWHVNLSDEWEATMDLSQMVVTHPYPATLGRVMRSFARQPDCQTCGASAIRHGLLLGGLSLPTSTLEAVLAIRENQGTSPEALRGCLAMLGLEAKELRKPKRKTTAAFLAGLADEFAQGAFLVPCILTAEHWVVVGAYKDGAAGVVDSFFDGKRKREWDLSPGLGFFRLTAEEMDGLDWAHHVTLVRPGVWAKQYKAWLPARTALLRLDGVPRRRQSSLTELLRRGVHQYMDDAEYGYRRLKLKLPGAEVQMRTADPGAEPVAVESLGEVLVMRRLGTVLDERPSAPEVVLRTAALQASQMAG